ncbi:MAG: hypothetical protein AAF214_09515, partial [Pseudomonadota bacterium]
MSFLPHASSSSLTWYGSMTASAVTHGGVVAFFMFSGMVAFLPDAQETAAREPEFAVSLEILDADIVDETEVIDEGAVIPPDAIPLDPNELEAAEQPDDLAALSPDDDTLVPDDTLLAPQEDEALAPDEDLALPQEADVTEPDVAEPDTVEPEVLEPEIAEPDVVEPDVTEPEVTEPDVVQPAPTEPAIVEPDLAELQPESSVIEVPDTAPIVPQATPLPVPVPLVPEPETPSPLAIDSLSPIDDTVLNPLADGGAAAPLPDVGPEQDDALVLAPEPTPDPDVLALVAPEPTAEPPVIAPSTDTTEPVVLPEPVEPEATAPVEDPAPDPTAVPDVDTAADGGGDSAGEDAEGTETASAPAAPVAPVAQPLPNPTASDIAIGQLLRRIRATPQPQCTLALPRRAGGDPGAGVSFIGADLDILDDLAERITDGLGFAPVQTREEI